MAVVPDAYEAVTYRTKSRISARSKITARIQMRLPFHAEMNAVAAARVWGANTMSSSSRSHREPTPGL
jgi:hypothetical protein